MFSHPFGLLAVGTAKMYNYREQQLQLQSQPLDLSYNSEMDSRVVNCRVSTVVDSYDMEGYEMALGGFLGIKVLHAETWDIVLAPLLVQLLFWSRKLTEGLRTLNTVILVFFLCLFLL